MSRKVEDEETRSELRSIAGKLELPDGGGVIVRTNALGETRAELQKDLAALLRVWKRIQTEARRGNGPRLLYSDQDLILRALRDHLDVGVDEILVDDETAFQQAAEYMQAFMPRTRVELTHYVERVPLFSKYSLESQIEQIFARTVPLPGGGSIVVDSTEALTAIDVNSGRAGSGGSHEDMALETNLQAAREVARQLRLRDLGGLVVVDFIDLRSMKNRRAVEKTMKDSLKIDRARSTVGRLSPNGLLEINRQRIQQSLRARAQRACPTCQGTGRVPSIESVGLNLMRRIEGRAATGRLLKARVEMHPELAEAMQNGRRKDLARLEAEYDIEIEIVASHRLHGPEEQIEWRDRQTPITMAPHKAEASVRRSRAPDGARAGGVRGQPVGESRRARPLSRGSGPPRSRRETAGEARRSGKKRRRGGKRRRGKRGDLPVAAGDAASRWCCSASDENFDDNGEPADGQLKVIRRLPRRPGRAAGGERQRGALRLRVRHARRWRPAISATRQTPRGVPRISPAGASAADPRASPPGVPASRRQTPRRSRPSSRRCAARAGSGSQARTARLARLPGPVRHGKLIRTDPPARDPASPGRRRHGCEPRITVWPGGRSSRYSSFARGGSMDGRGDIDRSETREWLEALDDVVAARGEERARFLLGELADRAYRRGVPLPAPVSPYVNTIPLVEQPAYPGDREIERRIKSIIRWNAMAMVVRANKHDDGIGGHISTYASAATLLEVGFNHFFRGRGESGSPATWSTSRATPRRASTPAPFSKAGCRTQQLRELPPRTRAGRRPLVLSAPVADAGLLAVPDRLDGPRPDHRRSTRRASTATSRTAASSTTGASPRLGLPRRRRDRRARSRSAR